jgi:hypothetical protein
MSLFDPKACDSRAPRIVSMRQITTVLTVAAVTAAATGANAMPNVQGWGWNSHHWSPPPPPPIASPPPPPIASPPPPYSGVSAPPQAAAAGYNTLTFGTVSNFTRSTVDMGMTDAAGYQWYFGSSSGATTLNADGSITLGSYAANMGIIQSAVFPGWLKTWHGTAIGGGAYIETTAAFDQTTINTATGWPSFWTYPLEHLEDMNGFGVADQWVGQTAGFEHFIEPDIMEKMDTSNSWYGGYVHDWYGYWNQTCSNYCNYSTPWNVANRVVPGGSTNFTQYHRYGVLWIPATATRQGSLTYYFDGVQVGPTIAWTQYNNQAPPPGATTPWTFGVIDKQHLVMIFGTSASTPMQVKQVVVWQASAANDLHQ